MGRICFARVPCLLRKGHRSRQFGETLWGDGMGAMLQFPSPGDWRGFRTLGCLPSIPFPALSRHPPSPPWYFHFLQSLRVSEEA